MKNKEKSILISVVIPTCNRPNELDQLLQSFKKLGYFDDRSVEIVVVNNSNDEEDTKKVCLKYPILYIRENIQCEGIAFNKGVVACSGKYIVKTDDDVIISSKDWLYDLVKHYFSSSNLGYLAGNVIALPSNNETSNMWEKKGGLSKGDSSFQLLNSDLIKNYRFRVWPVKKIATGANNMVPKKVYQDIGLYSTFLGGGSPIPHANSLEFVYRVIKAGYDLKFDSNIMVYHQHPSTKNDLAKKLYIYGVGNSAYMLYIFVRNLDFRYLYEGLIGHHIYTLMNVFKSIIGIYKLPFNLAIWSLIGSLSGNIQFILKYPFRNSNLYD